MCINSVQGPNHVRKMFYDLCPTYLIENFVPLKDVHQ